MIKAVMKTEPAVTVLLSRLSRLVYRRTSEELLGMRLKDYVALAQLGERTGISQQEMGSMLCVDANNLVILLNELEAAGLALRRRDPSDRRRHLVDITSEGRQSLERAERGIASVEDEVLGALSPNERASLQRLLSKAIAGAPVATLV
jgi:DNA-binding MarR family transcriptional regulator